MTHVEFNKSRYNNISKDSVIQVQHSTAGGEDGRQVINQTTLANSGCNISGLSIAFVPKFASSKILITAMINHSATYTHAFGVKRGTTLLAAGNEGIKQGASYDANNVLGHQSFSTGGGVIIGQFNNTATGAVNAMRSNYIEYLDTADSVAERTYHICGLSAWEGSGYNLYINDRADGSVSGMACISSITIYEIKQ